jgi:hypothetical protein
MSGIRPSLSTACSTTAAPGVDARAAHPIVSTVNAMHARTARDYRDGRSISRQTESRVPTQPAGRLARRDAHFARK